MTAQIPDTFLYKADEYELVGLEGGELFTPEQFDMVTAMLHTACYRGFYCKYELTNDALFLMEMTMLEKNDNYKPINGQMPVVGNNEFERIYRDLHFPVPFTGKIRLGKDFIQELYVHMGFQKASAYKTVIEFVLKDGKLESFNDISEELSKKRGKFKKDFIEGDLDEGINDAFSLDIDIV